MSGYGSDALPITSQTAPAKRHYLDVRAKRLKWSRAAVVTEIIDYWLAMGAPPLSAGDDGDKAVPVPRDAAVEVPTYWARAQMRDPSASRPRQAITGHRPL